MIDYIFKMVKSDDQKVQSPESNKETVQIPEDVIDAIVFIVRVTLLVGFVLGAICMGIIDRVVN